MIAGSVSDRGTAKYYAESIRGNHAVGITAAGDKSHAIPGTPGVTRPGGGNHLDIHAQNHVPPSLTLRAIIGHLPNVKQGFI